LAHGVEFRSRVYLLSLYIRPTTTERLSVSISLEVSLQRPRYIPFII
jgi:hypothetical protein